jgi:putative FmdB family regulatory protein
MPIYEYNCKKCGEKFEMFRGLFENDDKVACPVCAEKGPGRIMSRADTKGVVDKGNLTFPT